MTKATTTNPYMTRSPGATGTADGGGDGTKGAVGRVTSLGFGVRAGTSLGDVDDFSPPAFGTGTMSWGKVTAALGPVCTAAPLGVAITLETIPSNNAQR